MKLNKTTISLKKIKTGFLQVRFYLKFDKNDLGFFGVKNLDDKIIYQADVDSEKLAINFNTNTFIHGKKIGLMSLKQMNENNLFVSSSVQMQFVGFKSLGFDLPAKIVNPEVEVGDSDITIYYQMKDEDTQDHQTELDLNNDNFIISKLNRIEGENADLMQAVGYLQKQSAKLDVGLASLHRKLDFLSNQLGIKQSEGR